MEKWLLRILALIIPLVTPELRTILCDWIREFEERAKQTENPWDDILAGVLKMLVQCED